jgi:hypothetical protein
MSRQAPVQLQLTPEATGGHHCLGCLVPTWARARHLGKSRRHKISHYRLILVYSVASMKAAISLMPRVNGCTGLRKENISDDCARATSSERGKMVATGQS